MNTKNYFFSLSLSLPPPSDRDKRQASLPCPFAGKAAFFGVWCAEAHHELIGF